MKNVYVKVYRKFEGQFNYIVIRVIFWIIGSKKHLYLVYYPIPFLFIDLTISNFNWQNSLAKLTKGAQNWISNWTRTFKTDNALDYDNS